MVWGRVAANLYVFQLAVSVSSLSTIFCVLILAAGVLMVGGTLLSLSRNAHWFVRGWEFPRPLIAGIASSSLLLYGLFFFDGHGWEWSFVLAVMGCVGWQCYRVFPYTPFRPVTVQNASVSNGPSTLTLLISNVQQDNTDHERWLRVVQEADPDLILALEVNHRWKKHLSTLVDDYPHRVCQPQDNCYGLMLLSRLPLDEPETRFIVEDTVPSIDVDVNLQSGTRVHLRGVHPRPPHPVKDQHATERDAEIVIVGREIGEQKESVPTIVAGDFNDVAWSRTTELFMQLSSLLDPRMGRGFYNTFHARYPFFRFPLDHVFHSSEFKVRDLRVLPYVGSDHFPVLAKLSYEPGDAHEQPEPDSGIEEKKEAEDKVEKAAAQDGNDLDSPADVAPD